MDKYDILKLENQICFPLYAASKEVVRRYRPLLERIDLTYTQYIAMMVLWEKKTVSVKQLGECLYLDSGTLTPLLKSLEKKGLVKRSRSKQDERVLEVEITNEGMALRDQALEIPSQLASCVEIEPEEAKMLYQVLYKILGKVSE